MTYDFVGTSVNKQTQLETFLVGAYELGNAIQEYHRFKRYGAGHLENCRAELADFVSMFRMYLQQSLNLDYIELKHSVFGSVMKGSLDDAWAQLYRDYAGLDGGFSTAFNCLSSLRRVVALHRWQLSVLETLGEERYRERQLDLLKYGRKE